MAEVHRVKCDRCGAEGNIDYSQDTDGERPKGWGSEFEADLCDLCMSELQDLRARLVKEFMRPIVRFIKGTPGAPSDRTRPCQNENCKGLAPPGKNYCTACLRPGEG